MRKFIISVETAQKIKEIGDYVSTEFGSAKGTEVKRLLKSRIRSLRLYPYQGESLRDLYGYDTVYRKLYVPPNNVIYYVDDKK